MPLVTVSPLFLSCRQSLISNSVYATQAESRSESPSSFVLPLAEVPILAIVVSIIDTA
jgi:hypothetical protein